MKQGFWQGRRVFLTGHTGFKGSWLGLWLQSLGAEVRGYALAPETTPDLFGVLRLCELMDDVRGELRDGARLDGALQGWQPEVVFHLAAQPLVRASYADPLGTLETNVLGTARVLEAVRRTPSVRAVVSVTTDKVYRNREWAWGYRESDALGGHDPYSASKACAEMVSAAYRSSFLREGGVRLATARAGNVIGGGDWAADRLVPDLVRGFLADEPVRVRRPGAVRPWQHVLEPLAGYLLLAERLLGPDGEQHATAYNFGPADADACPAGSVADQLAGLWGAGAHWVEEGAAEGPHEAGTLRLDASRARAELGWQPRLTLAEALRWVVEWHRAHAAGEPMRERTLAQIAAYGALRGL